MSSNEIRVDGGNAIAQAVANKSHLKTLAIDSNEFGEAGCQMVRDELENCGRGDLLTESTFEDDEDPDSDEESSLINTPIATPVVSSATLATDGNSWTAASRKDDPKRVPLLADYLADSPDDARARIAE